MIFRSAGALECLDLADEDAVHLPTSTVGDLVGLGVDAAGFGGTVHPLVGEPVGGGDAVEAGVTGQTVGRQLGTHAQNIV